MIFSKTAIIVDKAAKLIKIKNNAPQSWPAAIWLKILGRVTNTNPGPCPASIPKAKQAGIITKPANKATVVSKAQILKVSPVNERVFADIAAENRHRADTQA